MICLAMNEALNMILVYERGVQGAVLVRFLGTGLLALGGWTLFKVEED